MNWYLEVLKKYAVFNGRARRKEYWMFVLVNFIIALVLALIGSGIQIATKSALGTIISPLYNLAVLIPAIAVSVRRLHDTNRSGWWVFIALVPLIGAIVLIVFLVQDSQADENQYGPNPKAASA